MNQIPLSSFQTIKVPGKEKDTVSIKSFIESKKLKFAKGNGFYQLSKPENIQLNKKILVQKLSDPSNLITGDAVRTALGISDTAKKNGKFMVDDKVLKEFNVFVQSTSYNRNLIGGTTFLYVKEGTDPFSAAQPAGQKRPAEKSDGKAKSTKISRSNL